MLLLDQFVIPGNIIYKQRGTIWHAGENAIRGRDHTIHAAVQGYVKYYRDPERHPDKQYIGVAFNKEDTLPYPRNEPRRRKLNMLPVQRKVGPKPDDINASGLPRRVVIPGGLFDIQELEKNLWRKDKKQELSEARKTAVQNAAEEPLSKDEAAKKPSKKAKNDVTNTVTPEVDPATGALVPISPVTNEETPTEPQGKQTRTQQRRFVHHLEFIQKRWLERRRTRTLHFNAANYSYAETNTAIGRLASRTMYIPPWKLGGRKSRFRSRRQRREKELLQQREKAAEDRIRKKERKLEAERKRAAKLAKQLAAGAGKKKAGAKGKPLLVEGPAQGSKPVEGEKESKPAEGKKPE